MNGKIFFWTTFLELFETYPKKSLNLAFIQGPSCKYSSCADLGPFYLAGRAPASQARQSHGEHSSLTYWEGAYGLHILAFGMMGASAQCFWIHWMSCNLHVCRGMKYSLIISLWFQWNAISLS